MAKFRIHPNNPEKDPTTVLDILDQLSAVAGTRTAFTFLPSGDATQPSVSITFGELQRRARIVAAGLRERCRPGNRIVLLHPPGIDYIVDLLGILYAGATAVPAPMPQRRTVNRLLAIVRDAKPEMALTSSAALGRLSLLLAEATAQGLRCVASDQFTDEESSRRSVQIDGEDIAFLQYTSGSTGSPKGVRISHRALMQNQRMIRSAFGSRPESTIVSWLPLYHDMGLIGTVFHPLFLGAECVLMAPTHFLQRPSRWVEAISTFGATISGGPDSAFRLCAERTTQQEKESLQLDKWTVAFNGSERVRPETMAYFAEAFASCGFRRDAFHPCYGLAEATLVVSGGRPKLTQMEPLAWAESMRSGSLTLGGAISNSVASSGPVVAGTEVRIVDPETCHLAPDGTIGEIWVRGSGISAGYWSDSTGSDKTFNCRVNGAPGLLYLRTGDLGFLYEGELFPAGRLKDLIVINGANYFPEDLERATRESHAELAGRGVAAFAIDDGSRERVIIVSEVRRRLENPPDVLEAIRRHVASEHGLRVDGAVLLYEGALPRTSSGKVQRGETRSRYLDGSLAVIAEWRAVSHERPPVEAEQPDTPPDADVHALADWIARRVGTALGGVQIRPDEALDSTGLDSLAATAIAHDLEAGLKRRVCVEWFFTPATPGDIAGAILSEPLGSGVDPGEIRSVEPLTPGQLSLWLLHRLAPADDPYRIASMIRMQGTLDYDAARLAVQALVTRHEALRTIFTESGDQRVLDPDAVRLEFIDATKWSDERFGADLIAATDEGMDLMRQPLTRFILYARAPREHALLIVAHHIICDGWSMEILQREFGRLYAGHRTGMPPAFPFRTYQAWLQRRLREPDIERQLEFWVRRLSGVSPLPVGAPECQSGAAMHRLIALSAEQLNQVRQTAQRLRVPPFAVFAAALQADLHRVTETTDIAFGMDTANRPNAWMRGVVGMIANQIVLRRTVAPESTFRELAKNARADVAEALRHQEAPFSWIVRATNPPRQFGRNPLVQVMFTYRNRALPVQEVNGLAMQPSEVTGSRPKFDITLALTDDGCRISGFWQFNPTVVNPRLADQLASTFEDVLRCGAELPTCRVAELTSRREAVAHI